MPGIRQNAVFIYKMQVKSFLNARKGTNYRFCA